MVCMVIRVPYQSAGGRSHWVLVNDRRTVGRSACSVHDASWRMCGVRSSGDGAETKDAGCGPVIARIPNKFSVKV